MAPDMAELAQRAVKAAAALTPEIVFRRCS